MPTIRAGYVLDQHVGTCYVLLRAGLEFPAR